MTIEDGAICCPSCGERCLHHWRVETYIRDGEDSQTGLSVTVGNNVASGVKVGVSQKKNPSRRRDGIVIQFWCENCEKKKHRLAIYQHKGNTFVEWME